MSRIRTNLITNRMANGAPTVSNGLVISGVTTVTTLDLNGDLDVDGHLNADNVSIAGVVTATSFVGSGANLTGITQTTINNNGSNRIITGSGTANTLEGEATFTYDGVNKAKIDTSQTYAMFQLDGSSGGAIEFYENGTRRFEIYGIDAEVALYDRDKGAYHSRFKSGGDLEVSDGKVHIKSSGEILRLETTASGGGQCYINFDDETATRASIGMRGSSSDTLTLAALNGSMRFDVQNKTQAVNIDTGGRLLVNTTSSSISSAELFEVKSTGTGFSHFRNNSSTYAPIYIDNEASNGGATLVPIITVTDGGGNRAGLLLNNNSQFDISGQGSVSLSTGGTIGSATARLNVNSSGQVTQPAQPSFAAYKNAGSYGLNNQIFPLDSVRHNIGSHYNTSNYRFTAPVAGRYLFTFYSILNSTVNSGHYEIRINNSSGSGQSNHFTTANGHWDHVSSSHLLNLNANDYVTMWSNSNIGWHGGSWQLFCGELLS